jgi:hypothetical protein
MAALPPRRGLQHAGIGIEGAVGDERLGFHVGQQRIGTGEVVRLAAGQGEAEGVAERVHEGVDLGASPPLLRPMACAPLPLRAPALCWWARTTVLSSIAYSVSASLARCRSTRSHTPPLAQRPQRVCTAFQEPKRFRQVRQGMPAR